MLASVIYAHAVQMNAWTFHYSCLSQFVCILQKSSSNPLVFAVIFFFSLHVTVKEPRCAPLEYWGDSTL